MRGETRRDDGLSIVGIVVATFIILIALIPAASLLESTIAVSGNNRHRVVAANLGTAKMEQLRALAQNNFSAFLTYLGTTTANTTSQGTLYTTTSKVTWTTGFITGGCAAKFSNSTLASTTNVQPVIQAVVTVTWQNERLATPVTLTEALNPPSGAYSSTAGNILVSVLNAQGQPNPGVNVIEIDNKTGYLSTATTDVNGCAFFANLAPDPYTITLNGSATTSGTFVNLQNQTPSTDTVAVTAGTTTGWQSYYDDGATLAVQGAASQTVASQFGLTIQNTNLINSIQALASVTNPPTFGPVFPEANGYSVWLGSCPDFVPATPAAITQAAVTPGNTTQISPQTATVQLETASTSAPSPVYVWSFYTANGGTPSLCSPNPVAITPQWTSVLGQTYLWQATVYVPYGQFAFTTTTTLPPTTPIVNTDNSSTPNATLVL